MKADWVFYNWLHQLEAYSVASIVIVLCVRYLANVRYVEGCCPQEASSEIEGNVGAVAIDLIEET